MSDFYTFIMGMLAHSWFEIMESSQFLIISNFWCWKMTAKPKWSNFSINEAGSFCTNLTNF